MSNSGYKSEGKVVDHVLTGTVTVGDIVPMGDVVGKALSSGVSGETISVQVAGRFEVAKTTGTAWNQGDKLDWDSSASEFHKGLTPAAGDVTGCAFAAADAAIGDATAEVIFANPGTAN